MSISSLNFYKPIIMPKSKIVDSASSKICEAEKKMPTKATAVETAGTVDFIFTTRITSPTRLSLIFKRLTSIYKKRVQQHSLVHFLGYKMDQKIYPLTKTTAKTIHHAHAITLINRFQKLLLRSDLILIAVKIIALLGNMIFTFLSFYIHNYLFIIGSTILATTILSSYRVIEEFISVKIYKDEIKNNLLRKKDDPTKPNALVLMTTEFSDTDKAFNNSYFRNLGPLAKKYNIDLFYPISVEHIRRLLLEKKYDHLLICGHGTPDSISFTPTFDLTTSDIPKLNFTKLNQKAVIALYSCSTGAMGGIAEKVAIFAQRKVFAPKIPALNATSIKFLADGSIKYKFVNYLSILPLPFFRNITRIIDPNEVSNNPLQHQQCLVKA